MTENVWQKKVATDSEVKEMVAPPPPATELTTFLIR